MALTLRLAGAGLLLVMGLAAAGLGDLVFDDGRLLYAAVGRDRLVAACLPELMHGLEARGFSPADVEFETRPRISVGLGPLASLGADFTFEDGAAATRIDGSMACVVGRSDVHVDFRTLAPPVRLG